MHMVMKRLMNVDIVKSAKVIVVDLVKNLCKLRPIISWFVQDGEDVEIIITNLICKNHAVNYIQFVCKWINLR